MNFAKLIIENFLTIGRGEVELDERGLLLIQGKNNDDPSAESNGAGKSSVVDALCWALYGVTARGVTGDAVVNKTAKKECRVAVDVLDGSTAYRIARHRKHSGAKNALVIGRVDGSGVIDMTKGTDKETQEVVNAVIGCSLDVFMAAVYAGQERMPDLPGMTDKMLKLLIEEAAGVEVLARAHQVARDRLNTTQKDAANKSETYRAANATCEGLADEVKRVSESKVQFEAGRSDRAKEKLRESLPIKAEKEAHERELAAMSMTEEKAKERSEALQVTLDAHAGLQKKLATLVAQRAQAERDLAVARAKAQQGVESLKRARQALADVDSQVGKPCGECGKLYCEHDLEAAREQRRKALEEVEAQARTLAQGVKTAQTAVEAAQAEEGAFEATLPDVSAVLAEQSSMRQILADHKTVAFRISNCDIRLGAVKEAAAAKLREANPFEPMLERAEKSHAASLVALTDATNAVQAANEQVAILEDAVKVFGPAGVRAHVLDTVTPYLNDRTQNYLGAMADGNIHAVWSTLSKTAKGELREKFNIEVSNDKGAESFAGLSGGEKRKVRLATAMALQDMVASRATKPINIFIADEVDHALDESGLERLMTVLEGKARERGTVLVISHNSLSDWIDEVITVTKTAGMATLAGATHKHGGF